MWRYNIPLRKLTTNATSIRQIPIAIRPIWLTGQLEYCNVAIETTNNSSFLNNVIINKTKVLLPLA